VYIKKNSCVLFIHMTVCFSHAARLVCFFCTHFGSCAGCLSFFCLFYPKLDD
jgi:hypothetical protein